MRGAIQFLIGHESVKGARVGALGFCMGGALALHAASKNPEVGACVVFYCIHPKVKPDFDQMRAPVIGFFGEDDEMVTPAKARELEATLKDWMRAKIKEIEEARAARPVSQNGQHTVA